ncbi:hypothetical protein M8997_004395 [Phyllobacterium sp. 21LDTY02-6]|uniref:rhamnosyltransferase WsaF family glycosyltransferase n=1 Tax=Phyllobacterium sp. 21LDTY02-6 TaxID=2944903 RepID=UPI0020217917|nr:rhamnan synthesis F family protein [Phyllobacterium sp. 21LDTY02-6]MCO4316411.1 hypothetical protein [Phyllobacterium sp. 21LDTY02-6]
MLHYASRAYKILRRRGPRSFAAHSLRFIAHKIDPREIPYYLLEGEVKPGRLNAIGAVAARTIPDDVNPAIAIPTADYGGDIAFGKVAVIAHIFYPELTSEMVGYIKNIPIPFGLFITTDTEEKKAAILSAIAGLDIHALETEVRVTPNRGRDIAPKYLGFSEVYDRYECFLHLHSKKSLHTDGLGNIWRKYLFTNLIGSKEIAETNLRILSTGNIGIVYAEHHDEIKEQINWGYDFPIAKEITARAGITLDANTILEFPSGSMFWGRSEAIRHIRELNLTFDDFPKEEGQIDGTLAHALERSLLLFAEHARFSWARVTTKQTERPVAHAGRRFIPLLGSEHSASDITSSRIPESYRLLAAPQFDNRPRLNLLLPTVNPKDVFGGIATALKIFDQIAQAHGAGLDLRIVVTDAPVSAVTDGLKDYSVQKLGAEQPAQRVLLDATDRTENRLDMRPTDVFVATAWWTALNAFRLHDTQKVLFGGAPKVVYLMQDFEPDFYGWSTRYALAESTYLRGEDTIALINSEELLGHFESKYSHPVRMVIPYQVNAKVDAALSHALREKIILFYSRPSAVRNCFESGIDGLTLWARRNPMQAAEWKVCCIGEAFDSALASSLPNYAVMGKMSLEEYASLLSRASVGLSLMISPHPSYPPLEMAYAGLRTITNKYTGKDLSRRSPFISSIELPTSELIAKALEDNVNEAEKSMIGRRSPIRTEIRDLPIDAEYFDPRAALAHIWPQFQKQ